MARYSIITFDQLQQMAVLETISTEAIIADRKQKFVALWSAADPPNAAQYDVANLEFDPIVINQECNTYFELLLRDRVNQAARATTLAYGTGTDLDAIASRYPGGIPRLADERDDRYRQRIWASVNPLSPHGVGDSYAFWAMTALPTLRDVSVTKVRASLADDPVIVVTCMLEGDNPVPSTSQLLNIRTYIVDENRKGATDVISIRAPTVVLQPYDIGLWLFPGLDKDAVFANVLASLNAYFEAQRWLGYDHTIMGINAAIAKLGVHSAVIRKPVADVLVEPTAVIKVGTINLDYLGRKS